MLVRYLRPSDESALRDLHERHGDVFPYADPQDPIHGLYLVAEDAGRLVGSVAGRWTMEPALMLDPTYGTPGVRWSVVESLVKTGALVASGVGVRELHLFPNSPRFAARLATIPGVNEDSRIHQWLNVTTYGGA